MGEEAERGGHRAYAMKQSWSWGSWAETAEAAFKPLQGV